MRVSNYQPDMCRQNPTIFVPNDFRRAHSPADELATRDPGKRKVQLVQSKLSHKEQEVAGGSVIKMLFSKPSYRSCVHLEVPLRSISSVVFLDKSLCISLAELEKRRTGQTILYKSALSCNFGVPSSCTSTVDDIQTKTSEDYGRARVAMLRCTEHDVQEDSSGHSTVLFSKHERQKAVQTLHTRRVNSKTGDSHTQSHRASFELLSFKGPCASNVKAGRQRGNADEAAFSAQSNFRHGRHTFNLGQVESEAWSKQARSNKTNEGEEGGGRSAAPQTVATLDETCHYHFRLKKDSVGGPHKTLSLKEALELFRPDFISRSQGRVRRLEWRTRRRKALQDSNSDLVQSLKEDRGKQKKNYTTPDPLSNNLFKPRERSISGKEMQLRSRRIYNKLPEVTKKKEEERKRAVSKTNRLRAEVFKKRLLDQILQR
ncbi:unnamed protein product [Menidia menidia]|uniref:(Atlantic silverside) hypothetical protein n=1 Tax=Menidia menidia TaxID=238744 RepID=A0A8S4BQK5_9TELE|nr:unnamed protein product [Menidia menidia]